MSANRFYLKCLAFFGLTFFNAWLGPWDIQIVVFTVVACVFIRDWWRETRGGRLFVSSWMVYSGAVTSNHLGAIVAAQSHYGWGWWPAAVTHLVFSFASQLPMAALILSWKWLADRLRFPMTEKLLLLPLFLYLGDMYLPELFPSSLLTVFSFYRLPVNQLYSLIGIEGVSFLFYLGFALLILIFSSPRTALRPALAFGALLLGMTATAHWERQRWSEADATLRLGVYQSNRTYNFKSPDRIFLTEEEDVLRDFAGAVDRMHTGGGKLSFVLFSETEFLNFFDDGRSIGKGLRAVAAGRGVALFGGSESWLAPGKRQNSFLLIGKSGLVEHAYAKRVLFPFGEYRPFARNWPWLSEVFPGMEVYEPGNSHDDSVPEFEGVKYGLSICYEDLFSLNLREQTSRGAEVLLAITNDGLFGNSVIALAHSEIARARALEARRPLVRVVRSGPSLVVRADGQILMQTAMNRSHSSVEELPFRHDPPRSFYHRYYSWMPWAFSLLSVLIVLGCGVARRTTRR